MLDREPNEPNRFDWVVEIDPYDAQATPVKRTARKPCLECVAAGVGVGAAHAGEPRRGFLEQLISNWWLGFGHSASSPRLIRTIASATCHSTVRTLMSSRVAICL